MEMIRSFVDQLEKERKAREASRVRTYVRPKVEGEIKGKLNLKTAKRARVKAWKAEKAEVA